MTDRVFLKKLQDMYPWFGECSCCLPQGWHYIVLDLCVELSKIVDDDFRVYALNEVAGHLNFYNNSENDDILKLIESYEDESRETCACCGDHTLDKEAYGVFPVALCDSCSRYFNWD